MLVVSTCKELLLRVLAAALGRDAGRRALDDLQERLLHALAADVAGDGRVVALAADLVDLVDVDDAALRLLDVVIGRLQTG
jgi:NAD(P)-dependent dehydrogenase (short-subunit alcohol dehydrogenase family)